MYKQELQVKQKILNSAIKQGGRGLSSGLLYGCTSQGMHIENKN